MKKQKPVTITAPFATPEQVAKILRVSGKRKRELEKLLQRKGII